MKHLFVLLIVLMLPLGACQEGQFHWITPEATGEVSTVPTVTAEPTPNPTEEVGEVAPEPTLPAPCEVIKGNISQDGRKLYFVDGDRNYKQVKINEAAGEKFFCSVEEAEAAGWVHAGNQ